MGAGSTVGVLITRGERGAPYVMPDLIGVYGARAEEVLRARGFRVSVVGDHPYPGVEAGVVLRAAAGQRGRGGGGSASASSCSGRT